MRLPSRPTAADAVAINSLAALLLGGGLVPDVDAELRDLLAEVMPRMSRDNPDMNALRRAAEDVLAGDAAERRHARAIAGFQLANILRSRAYAAWAALQDQKGQANGEAENGR